MTTKLPSGMADKTKSHYHTDPRIIEQPGIGLIRPGHLLYLNENTGLYGYAIANSTMTSRIAGIVWEVFGNDKISLRVEPTAMAYELPLGPEFFYTFDNGEVNPLSPSWHYIPGEFGRILYLSETKPGRMQQEYPTTYRVIAGYKTEDGFIFRPERLSCCA